MTIEKANKIKKCQQHPVFPGGLPSKYWPGLILLYFSEWFPIDKSLFKLFQILPQMWHATNVACHNFFVTNVASVLLLHGCPKVVTNKPLHLLNLLQWGPRGGPTPPSRGPTPPPRGPTPPPRGGQTSQGFISKLFLCFVSGFINSDQFNNV